MEVKYTGKSLLSWYYVRNEKDGIREKIPDVNPISKTRLTGSQKATLKYFWVVSLLILVQILMGVITAALDATFSALEVVPLVLMGYEAYHNLKLSKLKPWVRAYKWPIYSFVAVSFWN